jgi:hypothetical protein
VVRGHDLYKLFIILRKFISIVEYVMHPDELENMIPSA